MKISASNVLIVVCALLIGRCSADLPPPPVITNTVTDTVPPAWLADSIGAMRIRADGLQARLHDRDRRPPERITTTDTLFLPPDTIAAAIRFVDGSLRIAPLIRADSARFRPELHQFNVADCDDGFSWTAGELVCDKARFGHLAGFAGLGVEKSDAFAVGASVGLAWKKSDRSPWSFGAAIDARGTAEVGVIREWSIW